MERMVQVACDSGASMVYSDRWEKKADTTSRHPSIDYQVGSVRDDFDFGSLWLIRGDLFRQWSHESSALNYKYGEQTPPLS